MHIHLRLISTQWRGWNACFEMSLWASLQTAHSVQYLPLRHRTKLYTHTTDHTNVVKSDVKALLLYPFLHLFPPAHYPPSFQSFYLSFTLKSSSSTTLYAFISLGFQSLRGLLNWANPCRNNDADRPTRSKGKWFGQATVLWWKGSV